MTELTVVVPVYKNAVTLEELYRRLVDTLAARFGVGLELVFVDDDCPEGSLTVLRELARRDERVVVLKLERNVGQNRALLAGLAGARGRRVVLIDADLQDPPEAIPALLDRLDEGYAGAFAGRRGRYAPLTRQLTSWAFRPLRSLAAGVPRDAGLFVALDRRMVERLLSFGERAEYIVPMIGLAGLPITSVPVERERRRYGLSAYTSSERLSVGIRSLLWAVSWRLGLRR